MCTGNTGRSAMAENIMKAEVARSKDSNIQGIQVSSAGLHAHEGEKAENLAVEVMGERGIVLDDHTATQVTQELLESFDLILTMESKHRDKLIQEYNASEEKTHLLTEFAGEQGNVEDCWGHSKESYESCVNRLIHLIENLIRRIQTENKKE